METTLHHSRFAAPLFTKSLMAGSYPSWPSWVGGAIASAWAGLPFPIFNLMVLMGIDFMVGLLAALNAGVFSAIEARRGLVRKVLMLLVILAVQRLAQAQSMMAATAFAGIIANAFCVAEAASIFENAATAGVPIPQVALDLVAKAKQLIGRKSVRDLKREMEKRKKDAGE